MSKPSTTEQIVVAFASVEPLANDHHPAGGYCMYCDGPFNRKHGVDHTDDCAWWAAANYTEALEQRGVAA